MVIENISIVRVRQDHGFENIYGRKFSNTFSNFLEHREFMRGRFYCEVQMLSKSKALIYNYS